MTEHPLHDAPRLGASTGGEPSDDRNRSLLSVSTITAPVSALSFWLAIALPALYLPLLLTGLSSVPDLATFMGLFTLHLLALFIGRSHRRG